MLRAGHFFGGSPMQVKVQPALLIVAAVATCLFLGSCGQSTLPTNPTQPSASISITAPAGGANVFAGGQAQFTASVTGAGSAEVIWTISEPQGGSISNSGLYTAPSAAGTYHVVATLAADSTKSSTAPVTVTVSKPSISSTPPLSASQGSTYSYTVSASDPSGAQLRYSLQGPPGAVLSDNSVTWTPTDSEARDECDFTVTVTNPAGGSQSQSWTVVSAGTIQITAIDLRWVEDQHGNLVSIQAPANLSDTSTYSIAALVPQQDGTVVALKGTGSADGTATIQNVPAGSFWLQMRPGELYWTSSNTFDYGSDLLGRPTSAAINTTVEWDLENLAAWDPSLDSLTLFVPNAGVAYTATANPNPGDVGFVATEAYSGPGTREQDAAYVIQKRYQSLSAESAVLGVAAMGTADDLQLSQGEKAEVESALSPPSTASSVEIAVRSSDWNQFASAINPGFAFTSGSGQLLMQPLRPKHAALQGGISLVDFAVFNPSADQDLGATPYGSLLPATWSPLFSYSQTGTFTASVPSSDAATVEVWSGMSGTSYILPTVTEPAEPLISPVQNPQVNGISLFATTNVSGPPALSWTAPSGSSPVGYSVAFEPVLQDASGYFLGSGPNLYTTGTSITVPPGLLTSGAMYVISITAFADARANFATAPWRSGYPMGWADVVSAVVTYTESASAGTVGATQPQNSQQMGSVSATAQAPAVQGGNADQPPSVNRTHAARSQALQGTVVRPKSSPTAAKPQ